MSEIQPVCLRPECHTTAGCAHRGPNGEFCHSPKMESYSDLIMRHVEDLERRVSHLETMKRIGL